MSKIRMVIEFDLKEKAIKENELDNEIILENILLKDNGVAGCFEIVEQMPNCGLAYNQFIANGTIIKKEIIN